MVEKACTSSEYGIFQVKNFLGRIPDFLYIVHAERSLLITQANIYFHIPSYILFFIMDDIKMKLLLVCNLDGNDDT